MRFELLCRSDLANVPFNHQFDYIHGLEERLSLHNLHWQPLKACQ